VAHSPTQRPLTRVPAIIRFPGPMINRLLGLGLRIGPNWLLTVRGRKSGELRTQPLAVIEVKGSKYVIGTFGEVNWCRNLRANPDAEISRGSRHEQVRAVELQPDEAAAFFRNGLVPELPHMPLMSRIATKVFIGSVAPDIYADPDGAALRRPVFRLQPKHDHAPG
jgi:deazaflavin-dependent oxidoreductase (nitroreductase family)